MDSEYINNSSIILLLAQRLKDYRLAARLSQKELSERSGVSLATICHFEQGKNPNLTLSNLLSILRAFGLESRLEELVPQLPMPPLALKEIEKYIPKRVRRSENDK